MYSMRKSFMAYVLVHISLNYYLQVLTILRYSIFMFILFNGGAIEFSHVIINYFLKYQSLMFVNPSNTSFPSSIFK